MIIDVGFKESSTALGVDFNEANTEIAVGFGEVQQIGAYDAGFEAGQKSEYDRFWDAFQDYGNRNGYDSGFAGVGWTVETFKPKYDIKPVGAYQLFRLANIAGDLVEILENCGVELSFSKCTMIANVFYQCAFTRVGVIDATSCTNVSSAFSGSKMLVTVDKFILNDDGSQALTNVFYNSTALQNITIEGVIGTDVSFSWSPLTVASMKSVISCLKNYAGTSNEFTYTVKFNDACWAALEADSTSPSGTTWKQYVNELGWNI